MRAHSIPLFATALMLLLLSACMSGKTTRFPGMNFEPRPENHPIEVYHVKLPECPFEEIGTVSAKSGKIMGGLAAAHSDPELIGRLKKEARKLGGDGIAGIQKSGELFGQGAASTVLRATVIRFSDPDCTH